MYQIHGVLKKKIQTEKNEDQITYLIVDKAAKQIISEKRLKIK